MLVSAHISKTPTVNRLVKIWTERYVPNLSALSQSDEFSSHKILTRLTTLEGRTETIGRLGEDFVNLRCELAGVRARSLYEPVPNFLDFTEAKQLKKFAGNIYLKLLEFYQKPASFASRAADKSGTGGEENLEWISGMIPDLVELAEILEPTLMLFQNQYINAKEWRTLGSITTLLYFANDLLLSKLSPAERVIVAPYLKFVEEQIALPWQRMCAAAARHDLDSPAFILVEQLLPEAGEIAEVVFGRLVEMLPRHHSRRGGLTNSGIRHSCLRDLNMFQAYLWLCVLKGSTDPIEKELVQLCIMVLPRVGVKWELIEQWNRVLVDEILNRANSSQKALLQPYVQALIRTFDEHRPLLEGEVELSPSMLAVAKSQLQSS